MRLLQRFWDWFTSESEAREDRQMIEYETALSKALYAERQKRRDKEALQSPGPEYLGEEAA